MAVAVIAFLPFMGVIAPLPAAVLAATVVAAVLPVARPAPLLEFYRIARVQFLVGRDVRCHAPDGAASSAA